MLASVHSIAEVNSGIIDITTLLWVAQTAGTKLHSLTSRVADERTPAIADRGLV